MNIALVVRALTDLRFHWRAALVFHLLMQLLGFAIFAPLVTWIGHRIVLASGEPVISNFDIAVFVLSPSGLVFVLVIAAITVGLVLADCAGQTWIAGHAIARTPVTLAATIALVMRRLPTLVRLAARIFLRAVILAVPFLAGVALVWFTLLAGHDINYYLAERPPEWQHAKLVAAVLGAGYALVLVWQIARWVYALPILMFTGVSPRRSLVDSAGMTSGQLRRILPPIALWWILLVALLMAVGWIAHQAAETGMAWAGIDFRRVLPLVALYLVVTLSAALLYGSLQIAGHQFLVTRLYAEQVDAARWRTPAIPEITAASSRRVAKPVILVSLVLMALALGATWFVATGLNMESPVAITAHRGASVAAPENTLAAFRAAMAAGATYIELDVQRTRDGDIAVLHDGDLMRMAGDPRKLGMLTTKELAALDIGRKYGAGFTGEHVPLLAEVIHLVRGRMKINIELKYNVPDRELAPAVVALLRREDFIDQVVITSLDYAALKQIKGIEPRLKTGHIVTAAVGNVVRTEADFLSLNSARATPALIRRAHDAGKEIHVWTVNRPEIMMRMIERGVDNIITDDPALLVRVLQDRQLLSRAELLALRLRVLFDRPPPELTDPALVKPL